MQIRPSRKTDAQSMAHVYVQTWQDTYLGLVPFGYLYGMSARELEQGFLNEMESKRAFSYVAEDTGGVTGFISGGYARQGDHIYEGEIYALYVLKKYQRQIEVIPQVDEPVFISLDINGGKTFKAE